MCFFTPLPSSSVAYIGPGVTSYQGLNMGFRIYTMDGNYNWTTYVHTDYVLILRSWIRPLLGVGCSMRPGPIIIHTLLLYDPYAVHSILNIVGRA